MKTYETVEVYIRVPDKSVGSDQLDAINSWPPR